METENNEGLQRELEHEVVELFVRVANLLSLPRSLGEIYGCLYICPEPLCMEDLIARLDISKGSVSQGLRTLRNFGAIKTVYKPGERRDFYEAECELRKLVSGFLKDQVNPHLESGKERVTHMRELVDQADGTKGEEMEFLKERVEQLEKWRMRANTILPLAIKMIER